MKKTFTLLLITALAVAFDGTLDKDIFEYKINSFTDWVLLVMIISILLTIAWANSTKDD